MGMEMEAGRIPQSLVSEKLQAAANVEGKLFFFQMMECYEMQEYISYEFYWYFPLQKMKWMTIPLRKSDSRFQLQMTQQNQL